MPLRRPIDAALVRALLPALLAVLLGACGQGTADPVEVATTATPAATPAATPPDGGDADGPPPFAARLALLPDPGDGPLDVRLVDLARTADLVDVPWPPPDVDATIEAMVAMSGAVPGSVAFAPPPSWLERTLRQLDAVVAAAGWSPADLDWYAEVAAPPANAMVGGGRVDGAAIAAAQGGTPEGPWRYGEGEDLATDLTGDRTLDQLGRPVTTALVDGVVGMALTADALDPLVAGTGPTLADRPALRRLAELADAQGCTTAIIVDDGGGTPQMACQLPDVQDGPVVLLAVAGASDVTAESMRIEGAVEAGDGPQDRVDAIEVGVDGDVVTVLLDGAEGAPPIIGLQMLLQRDPLVPRG